MNGRVFKISEQKFYQLVPADMGDWWMIRKRRWMVSINNYYIPFHIKGKKVEFIITP